MADLSSAITRVGVSGGVRKLGSFAAKAVFAVVVSDTASLQVAEAAQIEETRSSYTQTFTRVGVSGGVKRYGSFSKTQEVVASIVVSDTARLSATEDPVDEQEISTADTARLSVSEVSQLFNFLQSSDTASLQGSETVNLTISGVTAKEATDTASLSLTEATSISVTVSVTDTASIEGTDEAGTVAAQTEVVDVTDTAALSVDESVLLNVFVGVVDKSVSDQARISITESGLAVEVNRIKLIRFKHISPRMVFETL